MKLKVGSLFSGIGGLDLGLERAGMEVVWQSEIEPYATRVLKKHWPEVPNYGDIKLIKWEEVAPINVLCGGYPCQPFSTAGRRRGEEDPRHLWPWVRDAISALRPRYAILENVRGHLSLGGASVLGELASIGYDAEWRVVSAASVGAHHRRDRLIIVAYASGFGVDGRGHGHGTETSQEWDQVQAPPRRGCSSVADSDGLGRVDGWPEVFPNQAGLSALADLGESSRAIADYWAIEPNVGRVAHGIPSRVDRLRGLGNAVVPQVAEIIGRLVVAHYERTKSCHR